jgi:hypothetical protein
LAGGGAMMSAATTRPACPRYDFDCHQSLRRFQ